jgi:hypothetical protein
MFRQTLSHLRLPAGLVVASSVLVPGALAQTRATISISHGSASELMPDCAGNPIYAASLLTPSTFGGFPALGAPQPVCILIRHAGAGATLKVGVGTPNVELDAVSFGRDARLTQNPRAGSVCFSVDTNSVGYPFGVANVRSVQSEAICGDADGSAFVDMDLPGLPLPVGAAARRNAELLDGNGLVSCNGVTERGFGVIEPGDDVDALDLGVPRHFVLFSLDAGFPDPCGGANLGSAVANGFAPGAILVSLLNGMPANVWATPGSLGLDFGGFATDDLDALAVWDNGNHVFDHGDTPLGWLNGGADMVLFSVRRGSWVIGRPDCLGGAPIAEGDVLIPPVAGGMSPFPGILIPAEQLGLSTVRSGTGSFCGAFLHGDDLDALDTLPRPLYDCNQNGTEDALDIARGVSIDVDGNGIPDECE